MNLTTQTPRLIIREFLPEEQNIYLAHFDDEEVRRHIPKRSREERINIFNTALVNYAKTKQTGIWGIFDKETGYFIGSCLLRAFDGEIDKIEVGYSLQRSCWGNGLATEVAQAIVGYALADAETKGVVAVTTLENIASQRVLEKAGLVRVDNVTKNGEVLAFFKSPS